MLPQHSIRTEKEPFQEACCFKLSTITVQRVPSTTVLLCLHHNRMGCWQEIARGVGKNVAPSSCKDGKEPFQKACCFKLSTTTVRRVPSTTILLPLHHDMPPLLCQSLSAQSTKAGPNQEYKGRKLQSVVVELALRKQYQQVIFCTFHPTVKLIMPIIQ